MNVTSEYIQKYKNLTGDDLYGIILDDDDNSTTTRVLQIDTDENFEAEWYLAEGTAKYLNIL